MDDLDSDLAVARRDVLATAAASALFLSGGRAMSTGLPAGAAGFDFLLGRWSVRHRKLAARLSGSDEWISFAGTLHVRPFLNGLGNIDENVLHEPGGHYLATSIRIFRPGTDDWAIYWTDGRRSGLDKPVIGRFEGRKGRFYNDDLFEGRPIRVRFTYEDLSPSTARWSLAFSPDAGGSWETNWIMDFERDRSW